MGQKICTKKDEKYKSKQHQNQQRENQDNAQGYSNEKENNRDVPPTNQQCSDNSNYHLKNEHKSYQQRYQKQRKRPQHQRFSTYQDIGFQNCTYQY